MLRRIIPLLMTVFVLWNVRVSDAYGISPQLTAPSQAEWQLFQLLNQYRQNQGLPTIGLSKSLTQVAKVHALDLNVARPSGSCNMHSWSAKGSWSPCCYTPDHAKAQCMWNKPRELTRYPGNGYENAYWSSGMITPAAALDGWKHSSAHNAVILNQGIWRNMKWQSMGVALHENYAVLWFGAEKDPDGYWTQAVSQESETTTLQAFLGKWYTKYGELNLWQDGPEINGSYEYDGRQGRVTLTYRNQQLEGRWDESGWEDGETHTGAVIFELIAGQLQGRWNIDGDEDEWYDDWQGSRESSESDEKGR